MKLALLFTAATLPVLFLASCGTNSVAGGPNPGGHPSGIGPFDSRGNYVEDWADTPSKWKKNSASPSKNEGLMASNDEPPADSIPLPTPENTPQPGNVGSTPVVVSRPTPTKATSSSSGSSNSSSSSVATKPKPKASTATASSKPKVKKPSTVRYTVKKGDTLSAIASRNKTTVTAIQRANGIKGSLIQPGKALVIPKY
jgi:FOG: LysM repeat